MTRPSPHRGPQASPDGLIVRGRPRFAMTPTSLLRNPTISSHAVRLWSVLASYTYGDRATDRPSRSQLASDVGWKSVRSVDTYLAELQRAGYLTIQHQWRADRGQSRSLYILEWEPTTQLSTASTSPPSDPISAGHRRAQDSAPGDIASDALGFVESVSAGRDPAQHSARSVAHGEMPAQNPAVAPRQNSAHQRKESTTKRELPPAWPAKSQRTASTQESPNLLDPADALLKAIRAGVPDRIHAQLSKSTLVGRATALVRAGWTDVALTSAITRRNWASAGPGAVMTWLTDLACAVPPRLAAPIEDPRSATFRLRAQHTAERLASAAPESHARQQAKELAAALGKRRRISGPNKAAPDRGAPIGALSVPLADSGRS